MDHVFLGLVLIGCGMTIVVIREAMNHIDGVSVKRQVYLTAIEQAQRTIAGETAQADQLQQEVDALKEELANLLENERAISAKVMDLEKNLAPKGKKKGLVKA